MTTIKVIVNTAKDASFLVRLLKSLNFVSKVEQLKDNAVDSRSQYENVQKALDEIQEEQVFRDIEDPIKWQKNIRNEWQ